MIMGHAALVALALQCVSPKAVDIVVGIVEHESGGNTMAMNRNKNGTIDVGLGQINSSNLDTLSVLFHRNVTISSLRSEPCLNLKASEAILFIRYNGHPPAEVGASYARAVLQRINDPGVGITGTLTSDSSNIPKPPIPPSYPFTHPARSSGELVYAKRR